MVAKTRPDKRRLFFLLRVASRLLGSTIWLVLLCCVPPLKPWYSWGCNPEAAPTAPSTISARHFIALARSHSVNFPWKCVGCRQRGLSPKARSRWVKCEEKLANIWSCSYFGCCWIRCCRLTSGQASRTYTEGCSKHHFLGKQTY